MPSARDVIIMQEIPLELWQSRVARLYSLRETTAVMGVVCVFGEERNCDELGTNKYLSNGFFL